MYEFLSFTLYNCVLATIAVLFFAYLFPFRLPHKILLIVPIAIIVISSSVVTGLSVKNFILNFALTLLSILFALAFFECKIQGILYALILETIMLVADGFAYYVIALLFGEERFQESLFFFLAQLFATLFISISACFIAKRLKAIQYMDIPKSYWMLLLITPVGCVWLMYTINGLYQCSHRMRFETLFSVFVLFIVIAASTIIYGNIVDYFNVKLGNQVLASRLEAFNRQQNSLNELSRVIKHTQHDLKNKLHPILTALEDGNYQKAETSLLQVIGDIDDIGDICYTGLKYIDDMLNYKAGIARRHGISFKVNDEMESRPIIPFMDISTAIGIALDNAIEACQKDGARKEVLINFTYSMGQFFVRIENDLIGKPLVNEQGDFMSTKSDANDHGLGLISIRNLLQKCGGDLRIETKEDRFVLKMNCASSD